MDPAEERSWELIQAQRGKPAPLANLEAQIAERRTSSLEGQEANQTATPDPVEPGPLSGPTSLPALPSTHITYPEVIQFVKHNPSQLWRKATTGIDFADSKK